MANSSEIAIPLTGMGTDYHRLNGTEKTYCFALNAITSDFFTGSEFALGNEASTVCSTTFPPGYQVVGKVEVPEQKRVIYILTNPTNGNSQIGEVLNCQYQDVTDHIEKVVCDTCPEYVGMERPELQTVTEVCHCQYYLISQVDCLNLDVNFPVDVEYKLTKCGINLYFTDYKNERSFMYLDYENGNDTDHLKLADSMKVRTVVSNITCNCPPTYTYNPVTDECEKITTTPIIPSGQTRVACAATSIAYTNFGVALYDAGYNINGTGTSSIIHTALGYWSNPGPLSNSIGVLNRVGLWACDPSGNPQSGNLQPLNEYIGFVFPINVATTKTYYIGIAGDNEVRIRVDCETVVDMNDTAMAVQYPLAGITAPFKYWHIYPVTLTAGRHVIELTGINFGGPAGFGAEIYDNTAAQIIASPNGELLNILFSTANMRGLPLQVSSTFSGNCPDGSCLDIINGTLVCTSLDSVPANCPDCTAVVYQPTIDCARIKMHPDYEKPCVEFLEFVNGGNLKEGVYQVLIAYADSYGNPVSNYMPASATAPLFNEQIKFETNGVTSKALRFKINGLTSNTFFENYNIVIAQTIDNFTEFIYVGTYSITQNEYTYTGFDQSVQRLVSQEVFFRRPYYPLAKGVTKANGYLFFTGVTEYPTLNLQPVANNINLYWETVAVKEKAYNDPRNTFYFHTYQRDEVYALGIVFEFNNGRETCAFHIPGRPPTSTDLEIVNTADVIDDISCFSGPLNKRWQVYNTGSVLGGDYEYNENCEVNDCWEYGNFAYWESTETYPNEINVWGDLCGKPIRHHRFPDSCVTHIHDGLNGTKQYKDNNYIFPIGIRVNHQSVINAIADAVVDGLITQEQADSIVSYRIVRGNRVGNKSIDAKGLLFNMFQYERDDKDIYFPNYAYNDLSSDDFLDDVNLTTEPRYTFHSPDTHFVNAGLGNLLKLETEEYGESEGYFTHSECQARHKLVSGFINTLAFGLGVAAALSATGEKECKVVTETARNIQQPYSSSTTGNIPVGIVSGNSPGPIATVPTPSPFTGTTNVPSIIVTNNNDIYTTYDNTTGLPIGAPITGSNQAITTCKGEPHQLFVSSPILAPLFLGTSIIIQKVMLGLLEMDKVLTTLRELIPYKNYSVQYNSIGKYNNYKCPIIGNRLRLIEKSAYLGPYVQNIDEPSNLPNTLFETITINNWDRESSVYLKLADAVSNPINPDNSKVSMRNAPLTVDDLDLRINRDISSFYASVKRYVPNQYGSICNISYLETSACSFYLNRSYTSCETVVFGGDTFINRFALKRKMPFFLKNMCGLPDGSDILYEELGNAGTPKYFFNTPVPIGERITSITSFGDVINLVTSANDKNYDVDTNKLFYQNGFIHLFNYGIPYFLVESDINVDYRHGENNKEKDFYPHNQDLKEWLEEENVSIHEDNYYFYNKTYSKQNSESPICTSCVLDIRDLRCDAITENRLIYSEPSQTENRNDNWLIFKANSYYDFPLNLGKLITADGIEDDKVLVRLEKGTQIFGAYNTIQATEENIQVGTGGLFQSRPRDIATTDLGYAGTQNRDILHTEYGHIWADADRGQVFNLATGGQGMNELTKDGMRNWFKENLPFQLRKDFPNMPVEDIDNNLNGIGLHYCFDKRFNRFLITKLDYKLLDKSVQYNPTTKKFYIMVTGQPVNVELYNPKYFCNKSWTVSYNFFQKAWISFHSYMPNFYVEQIDTFESGYKRIGINQQKTYLHNATNKSYQVVYGKLEPFIVEFNSKFSLQSNYIHSIEYFLDVIRYHNEFDSFNVRNVTFNKALVYNESQTSGLMHLKVSNPEDLTEIEYPKRVLDGYEILTTNSENIWRFNDFWDVANSQYNNMPIFLYDCNNVNKKLNTKAINYDKPDFDRQGIREKLCRVRLINDKTSQYKFIFGFGKINQRQSFR
jgi:hypothetical protein